MLSFSYGVKKDLKYGTVSMSLVLDDGVVKALEDVISQCKEHLGKTLSNVLYCRDDGTTTTPSFEWPRERFFRNFTRTKLGDTSSGLRGETLQGESGTHDRGGNP